MTIQYIKNGKPILFDSFNWHLIAPYKWYVDNTGYAVSNVYENGKYSVGLKMHRLILGLTDRRIICDHKNRIRTDNRVVNLRITDAKGNARNSTSYGACKYLGVTKRTPGPYQKEPRFVSRIRADGRCKYLGTFKTEIEAAMAYNEAAKKYFGEFASLNKF